MSIHIYSILSNFPVGGINATCLNIEIINSPIPYVPDEIGIEGDVVNIEFLEVLNSSEIILLDAIVTNHNNNCTESTTQEEADNSAEIPLKIQKDDTDITTITDIVNFEGNVTVVDGGANKATVLVGGVPIGSRDNNFSFRLEPIGNDDFSILGWNELTDLNKPLSSTIAVTMGTPTYHSHVVFEVKNIISAPFTIRISGISIDETGASTAADTEDIAIIANGYYQTSKSWLDSVVFSILESSKSCDLDIYRNTYWDNLNTDFTIRGYRYEWLPESITWSFGVDLLKVNNDGSITIVDSILLSNTDTIPRAGKDIAGKAKKTNLNTSFLGVQKEGLIVNIHQNNIENFYIQVNYND